MLPSEDELPPTLPSWSYAAGLAVLVVTGYLSPLLLLVALPLGSIHAVVGFLAAAGAFVGWLVAIVRTHRKIRAKGDQPWRKAADILVLGVLPAWGLVYALLLADADCIDDQCGGPTAYRPFAATHVLGLVALHTALSLAYAISRRRSEALRPAAELTILSSFVVGIVVHTAVAIQFGGWLALGLVFPPVFLPCLAPLLAILFFGAELLRRLRLRGRDAMLEKMIDPKQSKYRDGERHLPEVPLASARVHRALLAKALGLSPVLLGVHFVIQGLWHGRPLAALEVLTKTCGYTLSQIPIEVVPANCHYLCTVAARGHRGLVRPERVGKRGGVPILVNRQLAIANAFEDLLHERWPRFGRLARRTYDALGLPVSRYIRGPWLADAVYLVMKPAEWAFYTALLLLDRRSPEARIDRMYR